MKKKLPNIYITIGCIAYVFYVIGDRFLNLPDFLIGLAIGIAIVFYIVGFVAIKHDISKLRAFKIKLYNKAVK